MKTIRLLKARIRFMLIILITAISSISFAQKGGGYYSLKNGDFLNKVDGVWGTSTTTSCNCVPDDDGVCRIDIPSNQVVHIRHTITSSCTIYIGANSYVVVEAGGTLTLSGGADMIGDGFLQIDPGGTVSVDGDVNLGGNSTVINNGYMFIGGNLAITGSGYICGTGILKIDGSISGGPPCNTLIILPIELLYFKGETTASSVDLYWETATEQNNDYFDIERSTDGVNYTELKRIKSKALRGNSSSNLKYNVTDENPIKGISYYRLKQTDLDKKFQYSSIISIDFLSKESSISFFPNPNNGELFVNYINIENKDAILTIKNTLNNIIYTGTVNADASNGNKIFTMPEEMPPGIYFYNLLINDKSFTQKIILHPR